MGNWQSTQPDEEAHATWHAIVGFGSRPCSVFNRMDWPLRQGPSVLLDWNGKHPIFGTGWRAWQLACPGHGNQAQGHIRLLPTRPRAVDPEEHRSFAAAGQGERDEMLQSRAKEQPRR